MDVGDLIAWDLYDGAYAIGSIVAIDGIWVQVKEAHAFDRIWGGSSACRGRISNVFADRIRECPTTYKHIASQFA